MHPSVPHLRLVAASHAQKSLDKTRDDRSSFKSAHQTSLFPEGHPYIAAFVGMSTITASAFTDLFKSLHPRWVLDLRNVPRFDIVGLSRAIVFQWFHRSSTIYRDVAGLLGATSGRDARLNPLVVREFLMPMLSADGRGGAGPVLFLLPDHDSAADYSRVLPVCLPAVGAHSWQVLVR